MREEGAMLMAQEIQLRAENAGLRGNLSKAIAEVYYWKEKALFFQAERDYYRKGEGF